MLAIGSYATADSGRARTRTRRANEADRLPEGARGPSRASRTGSFEATIDDDELDYTLTYSGLEGDVTQAHIHFGQRSVNGGHLGLAVRDGTRSPAAPGRRVSQASAIGNDLGPIEAADVVGRPGQGIAAGEFDGARRQRCEPGVHYANVHSANVRPAARSAARSTTTTSATTSELRGRGGQADPGL